MQSNRDNETSPTGTPQPPEVVPATAAPAGTQETVVREESGDPAVIITRTGPSYNTRVITTAVVALVAIVAIWFVVHQRHAPGSDANASNGEVAVDSTPIPQRAAAADTGAATGSPYWPAVPYATGQPAPTTVITPSPYTVQPDPYATVPAYTPPPPMPNPEPLGPRPSARAATPPASAPPASSSPTVFPRLDSILGVPTDSQGRAHVTHPRDTVTHIDSVLRRNPVTAPAPAVPVKVDTIRPSAPPMGSTTRADTSAR